MLRITFLNAFKSLLLSVAVRVVRKDSDQFKVNMRAERVGKILEFHVKQIHKIVEYAGQRRA